jgi:hypothetical protein
MSGITTGEMRMQDSISTRLDGAMTMTRRVSRLTVQTARAILRLSLILAVVVCAVLLTGVGLARASVDAVATAPDAIATGAVATNAGWDLVQAYGPLWGGLAVVLAIGQRWLAVNDTSHVLAQGRLLTAITGAIGVLGSVAQWRWTGAPSSGIIVTAFGAISLLWHPNVTVGGVPVDLLSENNRTTATATTAPVEAVAEPVSTATTTTTTPAVK